MKRWVGDLGGVERRRTGSGWKEGVEIKVFCYFLTSLKAAGAIIFMDVGILSIYLMPLLKLKTKF